MKAGLIGWAAPTGLGSLNRDFANQDWVYRWLAPRHPRLGVSIPNAPPRKAETSPTYWPVKYDLFQWLIEKADVLLFAEIPYVQTSFLRQAKDRGIKLVCVPMTDQLKWESDWIECIDLFYCPTKFALEAMETVRERRRAAGMKADYQTAGGWWGVDVQRFKFRQRTKCERFLFVNGWGGVAKRKGLECLVEASKKLPPKSVYVLSQRPLGTMTPAIDVRPPVKDNVDLYGWGDVLISPSRFEGFGLQYYEAQSCGMPVVVTDAAPMNECTPHRTIKANRLGIGNGCNPVHDADPEDLVRICLELYGSDIEEASFKARENVESKHDVRDVMISLEDELCKLVGK